MNALKGRRLRPSVIYIFVIAIVVGFFAVACAIYARKEDARHEEFIRQTDIFIEHYSK